MTERVERLGATAPRVTVDGVSNALLDRLVRYVRVEEATDGLKTLELQLPAEGRRPNEASEGELWLDGQVFDFGRTVELSLGASAAARLVFRGAVSAIEATHRSGEVPTATVFAEDALMQLRLTRRMRTYEDASDADIARSIAEAHGLRPDVSAEGPTYDVVQQWNQSDLAFLRERARLLQAEVWVADDTLHFATRGSRTATELVLAAGGDLLDVELRADLAHQRTSVRVSGYDATQRAPIDEGAEGDAIRAELDGAAGGRTGPDVLRQAFGERASFRVRSNPLGADAARAWARADMLRRARAFVTVAGTTTGSADMVVGSRLSLSRVGTPFDGGGYYVTRVCHTYDLVDGFRTHFEAERPTVNAAGAAGTGA